MREEKMVTEREARKREQRAFIRGREHGLVYHHDCSSEAARSFYPLPKIERQRTVRDSSDTDWRVDADGMLYYHSVGPCWYAASTISLAITPERARIWADLFANPTEEIDDDGSDRDA